MRSLSLLVTLTTVPLLACDEDGSKGVTDVTSNGWAHAGLTSEPSLHEDPGITEEHNAFTVQGTVVSDELLPEDGAIVIDLESNGTPARLLEIVDGDGRHWVLSYGIHTYEQDVGWEDFTPPLDVEPGQEVELLFRHMASFGTTNGFVLRDAAGLVAAMDEGAWGPGLEAGDVPGLTVEGGEVVGSVDDDCGTKEIHEVTFQGDEAQSLAPLSSGPVTVEGQELTAWAITWNEYVEPMDCTDTAGRTAWAIWR